MLPGVRKTPARVTVTAAAPAALLAARSTTALMPQSWSPAGSSMIWRTSHRSGVRFDHRRPGSTRRGPYPDFGVIVPVRAERLLPAAGVPPRVAVQSAQLVPLTPGQQLDSSEHRVADQYSERARIGRHRRWPGLTVGVVAREPQRLIHLAGMQQSLPLVQQAVSRPAARVRPATSTTRSGRSRMTRANSSTAAPTTTSTRWRDLGPRQVVQDRPGVTSLGVV